MTATKKTTTKQTALIDEHKARASITRRSFWRFCQEFWEEIPGSGVLVPNWHMEVICNELQEIAERIFRGEKKKYDLIINVSPGASKSSICSILFPAWMWTRKPDTRVISSSHTDDLVLDLANKSRNVIKSDLYQACFPDVMIREDQDTKGYYANSAGGDRKTCTIAGKSPTGFHAHVLICDDPIDPKKAISDVELKAARYFYDSVIPSRKVNKEIAVEITIMQRLHVNDPTGHLLERSKLENTSPIRHICLPAELHEEAGKYSPENVIPVELAKHYKNGLMDPRRISREILKRERATMGAYAYAGQYLQSPIPLSGGLFSNHYFNQRVKAAPYDAKRIRYWDRASTEGGGCYTAGVLLAKDREGNYYVEDLIHGQWEPHERNQRMRAAALKDRHKYGKYEPVILVEAEGGSSGRDAWKGVVRALAGFNVKEDRVSGSKEVRAEPWSAQLAAGNVYLVENGLWPINSFVEEHCAFPLGKTKDIVDASSGAFNRLVTVQAMSGVLKTFTFKHNVKKQQMQVIACNKEEIENLVVDPSTKVLLIVISDPDPIGSDDLPLHGIATIESHLVQRFTSHNPANYQDTWEDIISPYDKSVGELMMFPSHAKAIWSFIRRQRQIVPNTIVVCDMENEDRAISIAHAIVDGHRWDKSCITVLNPDKKEEKINQYVYDVTKAGRLNVI